MKLNVVGDPDGVVKNETDKDAMGGTELMKYALYDKVDKMYTDKFNIIPSRVRSLSKKSQTFYGYMTFLKIQNQLI